jgi:hypothetical protein
MDDSAPKSQKTKLPIELEIDGGQRMLGSLFVSSQQRLPDLLNDAQASCRSRPTTASSRSSANRSSARSRR